jgi:multiple sugar transport system substrate-binding protein
VPATIREGTVDGRLYGLNVMFGGEILYYNVSLIRETGLTDPYELAKQGKWTYDAFRRYAVAMTKFDADGKPLRFGCSLPDLVFSAPVVWAFGGDLLSQDHKRCLLDSPSAARAFRFISDLRWKDHAAPSPAQGANSAFNFESGKLGLSFNWMGMAPRYNKVIKNFDWDICPLPSGPYGNLSVVKGNQLVASRETAHPKEAWRFIRFMTSKEVEQKLYVEMRRNFPTRIAVSHSRSFLEAKSRPFHTDVYIREVEHARELPIDARWSEWTTAFNSELDALNSGRDRDAARVLKRAAAKATEVLQDQEGF